MAPGAYTISGMVPFVVASVARSMGLDAERLLHGTYLTADVPPRPEDHIDVTPYFGVWRAAVERTDAAFPLRIAAAFQLEDHEVFGFLAMSCQTLGEAYQRTAAVRGLYCVGARWEVQEETDVTRLIWYPWPGPTSDAGYRAAQDFALADMADAIRRLGRTAPRPIAVKIAHRAPREVAPFAAYFGVPPAFDAPLYELVYPPGLTALPIATFNSRLRDYFDEECRRLVASLGANASASLAGQVRKLLITAMDGGDTTIETIAKRLGVSARSLQRRLAEENTRYADLLAEIREEFAKRYLARGSLSASEVAYLIGFTEPPAFFKAFKRWTGMTPREFQQAAAPA